MDYCKEMYHNREIYFPSVQHCWDVATDISVLIKWGIAAYTDEKLANIDFMMLFWTSMIVQMGYRVVSAIALYKSEKSKITFVLQFCDILMFREIYISHMECRKTDTLVYLKKLEACIEAAPQLILTTFFFLRVGTLEKSQTEIISWIWSFYALSTKVVNDDSKVMYIFV